MVDFTICSPDEFPGFIPTELTDMHENSVRTSLNELPRFAVENQQDVRELRTLPVAE